VIATTLLGREIRYDLRGAERDPSLVLMRAFPVDSRIFPAAPGAGLLAFDAPSAARRFRRMNLLSRQATVSRRASSGWAFR
jgi:hypothetical protein